MDAAGIIDEFGLETDNRLKVGDYVVAYVLPAGPQGAHTLSPLLVPAASVVLAPAGREWVLGR